MLFRPLRPILLYKFAYGNSILEEINASFGSSFFPQHLIVVLYSHKVRCRFDFVRREVRRFARVKVDLSATSMSSTSI